LLHRAENVIAAAVEEMRIVVRQNERRVPVEAVRRASRVLPRPDETALAGAQIAPAHVAVLAFEVNHVRVERIDPAYEPVTTGYADPIFVDGAASRQAVARPSPAAVVLEPA